MGSYLREPDTDGRTVWKRYPRGSSRSIPLQEGNLAVWSPERECPQVTVRGRIRRRAGHWSVTLFLSNEQVEDRPRDMYWLFQAELAVRGRFASRPGQGHVSTLDQVSRLEDRTDEMLYRRDVEFARGHGISIECELAAGRLTEAVRIRTAVMPRAVVRTVEQCAVPGLITDMKELAEASDGDLAAKQRSLTIEYAAWIAELDVRRTAEADLSGYADAATQVVERARAVLGRLEEGIALLESERRSARGVSFRQPRDVAAARALSVDRGAQSRARAPLGRRGHPEEPQLARVSVGLYPDQHAGIDQPASPGPSEPTHMPAPTCCGFRRAAARRKLIWDWRPTRWPFGDLQKMRAVVMARTAWRC